MNYRTGETDTDRRFEAAIRACQPEFTLAQLLAMRRVSEDAFDDALTELKVERGSLRRSRRLSIAQPDLYYWPAKLDREANEVRRWHARVRKFRAALNAWDAQIAARQTQFLQAAE